MAFKQMHNHESWIPGSLDSTKWLHVCTKTETRCFMKNAFSVDHGGGCEHIIYIYVYSANNRFSPI